MLVGVSFLALKYVFVRLGDDAVGVIFFSLTMSAVLSALLEMGISAATTREVSGHLEREPLYVHDLLRTTSLFFWSAYLVLITIVWLVAPLLVQRWIVLTSLDQPTATLTLRILGIGALLGLPRSLYVSLFRGLQRMDVNNVVDPATAVVQQVGIIGILAAGGGLVHVATWLTATFAAGVLAYICVASRFVPVAALVPGYSRSVVSRNLQFSTSMMAISVLSMIHTQADKLAISKLLPLGTLGYYSVSYGLLTRASFVTGAISQAGFPVFSAESASGGGGLLAAYRKFQDLVCFTALPIFAAVIFASLPLFTFIFNADIAHLLFLPTVFLAMGFYMNNVLTIPYMLSLAVGRPDISARSNFLALFVVLPVTLWLVYYDGLRGAGLSWVAYHVFAYAYALRRICAECLHISYLSWFRHLGRSGGWGAAVYGVAWGLVAAGGVYSWPRLVTAYVLGSVAFVAGSWWLVEPETVRAVRVSSRRLLTRLNL